MPSQEHSQPKANKRSSDAELDETADAKLSKTSASGSATLDADVDAMLEEIDDLLEVNAEDFVKSFVQKGGQ
jgi:prokaryotic ubiquitin-like protein Pup